ncbi:MAG: G8 domain-containing protein [Actinomycetota bacterium]
MSRTSNVAPPGVSAPYMSSLTDPSAPTIGRRRFIRGALVLGAALAVDQLPLAGAFARSRLRRWSDPKTWGGRVPGRRDVVRISKPVLLDVNARVAGIVIGPGGSLVFHPRRSVTLRSTGNIVVRGKLRMAPASHSRKHRLVFVDVNERRFRGKSLTPLKSDVGLWVMDRGVLSVDGARKLAWTWAAGDIAAGASAVTLSEVPSGWRRGDEIAITPTMHPNSGRHAEAFDVARIKAIDGRTIKLSRPTGFAHPKVAVAPDKSFGAEVLNLTRNVMIEGTKGGRSHIFMRSRKPQHLKFLAVRHLGPRKRNRRNRDFTKVVVGRWPIHFHHAMGGSRGSEVAGVVARNVGSHAYVTHMSHGVEFRNCIAYDVLEDPYWWDKFDGTNDTLLDRCVAAKVSTDSEDKRGSLYGFVMGLGRRNVARNCVATGVMGTPLTDTGGFGWLEKNGGHWTFNNNVAHNNLNDGLFNWLNSGDVHEINRFTAYRNGRAGIEHGAYENRHHYEDCHVVDNKYSVILHTVSKDAPRLSFRRCILKGDILIPRRLGGQAGAPVLFIDSGFAGKIIVDHTNSVAPDNFGLYDFVYVDLNGRDLEPLDFKLVHMWPGSLIRVQRKNDTAYQINDLKLVTPIPPFM